MDSIMISESDRVIDGLNDMMEAAGLGDASVHAWTSVEMALLVIEVMRRAKDRPKWFPRGKWATMQAIQARCEKELNALFKEKAK